MEWCTKYDGHKVITERKILSKFQRKIFLAFGKILNFLVRPTIVFISVRLIVFGWIFDIQPLAHQASLLMFIIDTQSWTLLGLSMIFYLISLMYKHNLNVLFESSLLFNSFVAHWSDVLFLKPVWHPCIVKYSDEYTVDVTIAVEKKRK